MATFVCPAEVNDRASGSDPTYGTKHWMLNYGLNYGTWAVLTDKSTGMIGGDGAFGPNVRRTPADFTDGMSNTLGLSEVKGYTNRVAGADKTAVFPKPFAPPAGPSSLSLGAFSPTSATHGEWVDGKVHETGFTTVFRPNTKVAYTNGGTEYDVDMITATESSTGDTYAAVTSRSFHGGGVNSLLMDGSVRFIRDGVSLETWRALGTRAGGEVAANDL